MGRWVRRGVGGGWVEALGEVGKGTRVKGNSDSEGTKNKNISTSVIITVIIITIIINIIIITVIFSIIVPS